MTGDGATELGGRVAAEARRRLPEVRRKIRMCQAREGRRGAGGASPGEAGAQGRSALAGLCLELVLLVEVARGANASARA